MGQGSQSPPRERQNWAKPRPVHTHHWVEGWVLFGDQRNCSFSSHLTWMPELTHFPLWNLIWHFSKWEAIRCSILNFMWKKKELRNKSDIWLWISKSIIWHGKYFYLYWIFGFYFEFISVENSCCIQCFTLYPVKRWISALTFKYLFWFHWDKYLALARIWFAFYLYEEPILIRTTRDA